MHGHSKLIHAQNGLYICVLYGIFLSVELEIGQDLKRKTPFWQVTTEH